MPKKVDLTGKVFGRLFVVREDGKTNHGAVLWQCRCKCGNTHKVRTDHLNSGAVLSCGCLNRERNLFKAQHGLSDNRLYKVWRQMLSRCMNPKNSAFERYGARGISVCEEWLEFSKFLRWSLENGYKPGLTIDRIDNDGNYDPSNCRWTTYEVQNRNKRIPKNSTSGFKGVYWSKGLSRWRASISVGGKNRHLGYFNDLKDAVKARKKAERRYWGSPDRVAVSFGMR